LQEIFTDSEEIPLPVHLRALESPIERSEGRRMHHWWVIHRGHVTLTLLFPYGCCLYIELGQDYPRPIVDHEVAMKENLSKMNAAYKKPATSTQGDSLASTLEPFIGE
jgi:hypothetical protein